MRRRFRVGYVGWVPHPAFLETAAQDPELEIVPIALDQPESAMIQTLSSCHGYYVMAARDEATALALLWRALDAMRGQTPVWLVPCAEAGLVRTLYAWGARNVELHVASAVGAVPPTRGITWPTFLPETG